MSIITYYLRYDPNHPTKFVEIDQTPNNPSRSPNETEEKAKIGRVVSIDLKLKKAKVNIANQRVTD